jgi:hypothetical protein
MSSINKLISVTVIIGSTLALVGCGVNPNNRYNNGYNQPYNNGYNNRYTNNNSYNNQSQINYGITQGNSIGYAEKRLSSQGFVPASGDRGSRYFARGNKCIQVVLSSSNNVETVVNRNENDCR